MKTTEITSILGKKETAIVITKEDRKAILKVLEARFKRGGTRNEI